MINLRLSNTAAVRLTIFNARFTEGGEVEPGPGEEAIDEAACA
jgi:hypothetical protein